MNDREHPTVWQMLAAFASEEYELREVSPGEFEIIAIFTELEDEELRGALSDAHTHSSVPQTTAAYET